jgi:hypothetical protein
MVAYRGGLASGLHGEAFVQLGDLLCAWVILASLYR